MESASAEVSIVVPAFEEGVIVGESLRRLMSAMDVAKIQIQVIVVLDGPDQVAAYAINKLNDPSIRMSRN